MKKDVIELILQMNMTFYEQLAQDFSHTRQSAWQGWDDLLSHVRRKLANKKSISVLDIGCGNGRFAGYILGRLHEFEIEYEGWDLNQSLLEEARQRYGGDQVQFKRLNIIDTVMEMKQQAKPDKTFDLVVMFGVTHHIPSEGLRQSWFRNVSTLVSDTGLLSYTFWQPDSIPDNHKMHETIEYGDKTLVKEDLEDGDSFFSWGDREDVWRYVHLYSEPERAALQSLFEDNKFLLLERYECDGRNGRMNEYWVYGR